MITLNRASFNLLDEPWIPVTSRDGTSATVSLLEVTKDANRYLSIGHSDPLVTIATHRLVLAFLHRALNGPRSSTEAGRWLKSGFPVERLDAYAQQWRHRFDLFDAEYPFLQQPGIEREPFLDHWTRLSAARGSFNTNILFRPELRTKDPPEGDISAAEAALQLVAHQSFTLGGLIKRFVTSAKSAPVATCALTLVVGDNLLETLCLNLVPYEGVHGDQDRAVWEQDPPSICQLEKAVERPIVGLTMNYVWPARAILLRPDENGRVQSMYYAAGQPPVDSRYQDPMVTLVKNAKGEPYPMGYREGKAMWRDLHAFVPKSDGTGGPEVISHAYRVLSAMGDFDSRLSFAVYGMVNNKAKISTLRQELLRLPTIILEHEALAERLEAWVREAGDGAFRLKGALQVLARGLITSGDNPDPKAVNDQVASYQFEERYWPETESRFWAFLSSLPRDLEAFEVQCDDKAREWSSTVNRIVEVVYSQIATSLGRSAKTLRAVERGRLNLRKGFKEKPSDDNDTN